MKVEKTVSLNNGTKEESAVSLTKAVAESGICVVGFYAHSKASEKYVVVSYTYDGEAREWAIPFQYRRTETFIDSAQELIALIRKAKEHFSPSNITVFKSQIRQRVTDLFGRGATVTTPIFLTLLNNCGDWVWNKKFNNENPQRRIQDIKETGFTIATKFEGRQTYHMLLPFDPVKVATYETISGKIRKKIFKVHNGINAYTGEQASASCLPDHKFPEIRWDKDTPVSNEQLSEEEMRNKFQIVPENINQMKREVCRGCFQSGKRGKLNGIKFFYKGEENWNVSVPRVGKEAERGCVGCFWYDMLAWRKALNEKLGES